MGKYEKLRDLQDLRSGKTDILKKIMSIEVTDYGISQEDLDNPIYQHKVSDDESDKFSKEDFKIINLYRYVAPEYGASNIGSNTRDFCKNVVYKTQVTPITYQQILGITPNPGLGQGGSNIYSVFKYRGGSFCRHIWVKYRFDTETLKLVEAPLGEQPIQVPLR